MKVKEISLQVVHNLGNYESVRYGITVEVEEGERALFAPLKEQIEKQHAALYPLRADGKQKQSVDGRL